MADYCRDDLKVVCGLSACTLGSVPGPTLGNEYGNTLLFYCIFVILMENAELGRPGVVHDRCIGFFSMFLV